MAVGTVKTNRKGLPKKSFSKKLKKGEMHLFKGSLMAMKWRHTRDVWMISTVHGHQMVEVMGRPGLSQAPIFKPQTDDDPAHAFNQTFILKPIADSFYVEHDIFRLNLHHAA
ncbi:NUTF2 [Cordylochernes scorpioides]|uniref:NUTF2 n=1 Tax=Cordylochernes scorpioides TaxID=51811 RepID=A0ABY6LVM7_9ARAC|nr:NUTF2 [Cordylochernes scorpioides]